MCPNRKQMSRSAHAVKCHPAIVEGPRRPELLDLTTTKPRSKLLGNSLHVFICMILATSIVSCGTDPDEEWQTVTPQQHVFQGDQSKPKSIFIFLDGTKNAPDSNTNVWRLYQFLLQNHDPQMTSLYIEGVGSAESAPITESALGRGMEQKVLMGYQFISSNYNPGDNIYIFGFSRGAHQARSLAGLISYAGVPATSIQDSDHLVDIGNEIIELVKKKSDEDYLDEWKSWQPGQTPILGSEIKDKLGLEVLPAQIEFLGLWDTVPGSSLKDYGVCKENKGVVKKYLYWGVPGTDKGERYKTDSYPAIRRIAHAVSLDEKRSKFVPILICQEINHEYTQIEEVWFPRGSRRYRGRL